MIKVDFHLHTEYSMDSLSPIGELYDRARELGLGKLVITDHNTIAGALRLKEKYPDYVIVGEEIKTNRGEILAYFVKEEIPKYVDALEAFQRLKEQNAFISLAHPYAFKRYGWSEEEMRTFMPYLDAIETGNARNTSFLNRRAVVFAARHGLAGTFGSDAHGVQELGRMGLELPDFNTADELRAAIRQSRPFGRESSLFVRYYSRKAAFMKMIRPTLTPAASPSH